MPLNDLRQVKNRIM